MFAVLSSARKALGRIALAATAFALAACQPVGTSTGPTINTNAPVPVALLVPSGSAQAGDELLAKSLENAARLAISDLDGVNVDLRVYSTWGQPGQAAIAATQAVDDGAKIILGPVYAQSANAVSVALANRNVNVLSFSNNTEIAGGNVFVLGATFQNTANRLASYSVSQGAANIMVVHDNTTAGNAGSRAIQQGIYNAGGTVAAVSGYEFSQEGIISAVPEIAMTARDSGADALFFTADTGGALPLITQLLVENRIDPEVTRFIGLTRWDIPAPTLSLPGVQGGWFALPDPGLNQQFQDRYSSAFGAPPHPIAGLAYDGIAAIGALVRQGNSDALTASALTQGAGFVGVNGIFRLLSDGTNERGLAVAQIRNRQVYVIDPAPRSFGGAGF